MMQRRFADANLHLWSFDKRHPERGVERKPIKRLFRVDHLYTIRRRDGSRDTSTETDLSKIEGRAEPVIARVISDAKAGRVVTFAEADRRALVDLFIAQHRRSPDLRRHVLLKQTVTDIVADRMARREALHGPATPEELASVMAPDFIEQLRHDVIAEGAALPFDVATPTMMQRGFSVGRIVASRCSFLLGSSPVARFMAHGTRRQDLGHPGTQLWLPVASDVAIGSVGPVGYSERFDIDREGVRKFNLTVALASTVFASASRDLVESYARIARRALNIQGPWIGS